MKSALMENGSRHSSYPKKGFREKERRNSTRNGIDTLVNDSPLMAAQRKKLQSLFGSAAQPQEEPAPKSNNTGLPDKLKAGIENLSGLSMDHVKVHYNSSMPAQLNALAYAQGGDIHVAPGQEQHLPHEAWHVVQQAQGRVKPTMQMAGGVAVNDDRGMEREADAMGARAAQMKVEKAPNLDGAAERLAGGRAVIQKLETEKLNVVGEDHDESNARRDRERAYCMSVAPDGYWLEHEFQHEGQWGDDVLLRAISLLRKAAQAWQDIVSLLMTPMEDNLEKKRVVGNRFREHIGYIHPSTIQNAFAKQNGTWERMVENYAKNYGGAYASLKKYMNDETTDDDVTNNMLGIVLDVNKLTARFSEDEDLDRERSEHMHRVANRAQEAGKRGVWKVGDSHIFDMLIISSFRANKYHLESQAEFNAGLQNFENRT